MLVGSFLRLARIHAHPLRWTPRGALAAVVLVAACGGRDADAGAGGWQFTVDTTGASSSLQVVGTEQRDGAAETAPVVLRFDCLQRNALSTIMTDQALRQGSASARVTVDSGAARRIPGFAGTTSSGGQLVLRISQDSMLGMLSGHRRARVEYEDGAGSSRAVAEFSIGGLEQYRGRFVAACARGGKR